MNVFEYRSVWPDGNEHIAPRLHRTDFFTEFDHAIDVLKAAGVEKANFPAVEIRTLETVVVSPWHPYTGNDRFADKIKDIGLSC